MTYKATNYDEWQEQHLHRDGYPRVGVTSGMRGFFAVLYDQNGPIQTGIGSYDNPSDAHEEAKSWAMSEGIPCDRSPVGKGVI